MHFVSSCTTDIGRRRSNNEDWLLEWPDRGLYVVADGMGGGKHGEVASHVAVEAVEQFLTERYPVVQSFRLTRSEENRRQVMELVADAVRHANTAVYEEAKKSRCAGKMGTTLTGMLLVDTEGFLFHAGDSRLYLVRNAMMIQLTADHTMQRDYQETYGAVRGIDAGLSNTLTRAIGLASSIEVDVRAIDVRVNDKLLLCTDGVHRYLPPDRIEEVSRNLSVPGTDAAEERRFLDREVKRLVDEVYEGGAEDNLSIILVAARAAEPETAVEERFLDLFSVARALPLFARFDDAQIDRVVHAAEVRILRKYDIIQFPLNPEGEILVMLEGQVSVLRRSRQIESVATGSILGEVVFFAQRPVNYTLFVDRDSTFLVLRRPLIESLVRDDPRTAVLLLWEICQVMAGHIITSVSHIEIA